MEIIDLLEDDDHAIEQVAALLVDFSPNEAGAWVDIETAYLEVEDSFGEGRISRVAVDEDGTVLGWASAAQQYQRAWELHPLVVRRDAQGKGVGRALVTDIEDLVRRRGGLTVYLGADDADGSTSLGGHDIWPGVLEHARALAPANRRHSLGFWRKLGYEVVGLIPDANGPGKHDIWMAKRVGRVSGLTPPPVPALKEQLGEGEALEPQEA